MRFVFGLAAVLIAIAIAAAESPKPAAAAAAQRPSISQGRLADSQRELRQCHNADKRKGAFVTDGESAMAAAIRAKRL
jgi:thiazole synthase ThiGH ThiG subunit